MLITPILKKFKSSLDAHDDILFEFTSRGGDQVFKNELEIYNAETNELFYNQVIPSFNTKHKVDEWTLNNGIRYKARIRTYNSAGDVSNWSDYINFKCSTTPTITLNPISNDIVANQTYKFSGTYYQAEGEALQSYKFILYDRNRNQIYVSDEMYSEVIEYEFTGLNNDENYYIEIKIKSVGSVESSTGLVGIYVKYIQPRMSSILNLRNNSEKATVSIEANTIQVLFQSRNENPIFVDDWIDLQENSIYTDRDFGFTLRGKEWTINLRFRVFDSTSNILVLKSDDNESKLLIRKHKDRLFIEYFYNDILLITKFFAIDKDEDYLNLYIQKNKNNLEANLKIN